jgi:succinylarginine dihydrolase
MANETQEVNFDGIVGPTHNYAGLSFGNLASQKYVNQPSSPRQAALEGLAKMKALADLGIKQAVLPPHDRPDVAALRRLGFSGSDAKVLEKAAQEQPTLLAACGSASAMWAANAATVSPSSDTADGRVHFTAANLPTLFHRSLETPTTSRILRTIFSDESAFAHHEPLPPGSYFSDEGAANHMRLASSYGEKGMEIFVYGRSAANPAQTRFPARQSLEASTSIARLHGLDTSRVHFIQQNPLAIEAGAFHNDVVAVANLNFLLHHTSAFAPTALDELRKSFETVSQTPLHVMEVSEDEVPLAEAISSYLFNSQIVGNQEMTLIAPTEARQHLKTFRFLEKLVARSKLVKRIHFTDVHQSMQNGGGPACLRLRVVLTGREINLIRPKIFLDDSLYKILVDWVQRHYRDKLLPTDLADPKLLDESRRALDELTKILSLGSIYPFQQQ